MDCQKNLTCPRLYLTAATDKELRRPFVGTCWVLSASELVKSSLAVQCTQLRSLELERKRSLSPDFVKFVVEKAGLGLFGKYLNGVSEFGERKMPFEKWSPRGKGVTRSFTIDLIRNNSELFTLSANVKVVVDENEGVSIVQRFCLAAVSSVLRIGPVSHNTKMYA